MSEETVNGIKIRYWDNTNPCVREDRAATGILDSSHAMAPQPL